MYKDWMFHKTEIHGVHDAHAAEIISHRILVDGAQFYEGTPGASLFKHTQPVKILWNEIRKDQRKNWKDELNAGELSRDNDTIFGEIVEDARVGQLRKCDYERVVAIKNVWRIASLSYAGVAPKKQLVMLIGKNSQPELKSTMLWKAELHGVAVNPPASDISVISVGKMRCQELMKVLKKKIEDEVMNDPSSQTIYQKWVELPSFTCRQGDANKPDRKIGSKYMQPFGERSFDKYFWEDLLEQGGGQVYSSQYSRIDCLRILVSMEPERCSSFEAFKKLHFDPDDERDWKQIEDFASSESGYLREKMQTERMTISQAKRKCIDLAGCTGFYVRGDTAHDMHFHDITFAKGTSIIEGWSTYTTVRKISKWVPDDDIPLKMFAQACSFESIDLKGTTVSDLGMEEVEKKCQDLTRIVLDDTRVTDAGVQALTKRCPNLQDISLKSTKVADSGVRVASGNALVNIELSDTAVTNSALREIAKNCKNLQSIALDHTQVDTIVLCHSCPNLRRIDTRYTKVHGGIVRGLLKKFEKNNDFELKVSLPFGNQESSFALGVERKFGMIHARVLGPISQQNLDSVSVQEDLQKLCWTVKSISLMGAPVTDITPLLKNWRKLRRIDLQLTNIGDASVKELAQIFRYGALAEVNLLNCRYVSQAAVGELKRKLPGAEICWSNASWSKAMRRGC